MSDWIMPTRFGAITDIPGSHRAGGNLHTGWDISVPEGTPVLAVADGTISHSVANPDGNPGGRRVYVDHADGSSTRYLHLSEVEFTSFEGNAILQGALIGATGSCGSLGDGDYLPHLHYERRDLLTGTILDPFGSTLAQVMARGFTWDIRVAGV